MGPKVGLLGPIGCWKFQWHLQLMKKKTGILTVELLWTLKDRPLAFKTWWW